MKKADPKVGRTRAIRLKCLDCCCGSRKEVRRCTHDHCPLWYFRFGLSKQESEEKHPGCFDITTVRTWE